jgi:hypothetical protein
LKGMRNNLTTSFPKIGHFLHSLGLFYEGFERGSYLQVILR